MIFGFNTDLKVGKIVYHVQTEDRGETNPVIDTTVYVQGRVFAKRGTSYKEFIGAPDFDDKRLREMLEQQHRRILGEVRAGTLDEIKALAETAHTGIRVSLENPTSFLVSGAANLKIAVKSRQDDVGLADAEVKVIVRGGAAEPFVTAGKTDKHGLFNVQFPMPRLGPDGGELVIQASTGSASDEIKFNMRKKG